MENQSQALKAGRRGKTNSKKVLEHINAQEKQVQAEKSKAIQRDVLCIPENINRFIIALFDNKQMPFNQYALVLKSDDGAVSKIHGSFPIRVSFIKPSATEESVEPSFEHKNMIGCADIGALKNVVDYLLDKDATLAKKILDTDGNTSKLQYIIRGSVFVDVEDINAEHKKGVVRG